MQNIRFANLQRILLLLAVVLILKVTFSVVLGYRNYFPPNFDSDFLSGRQSYFAGAYQWAFYAHIVSGPVSLILGLILISESFRKRFPMWHRSIGKMQAGVVLLMLAPSGLWMAPYAQTGTVAGIGFALLAIATGACVLLGWRSAVKRRFAEHRRWMLRYFLLLCSAVIVRIIGGLATVATVGDSWIYPLTAWASWLVPLSMFELTDAFRRRYRRVDTRGERRSAPAPAALSLAAMEILAPR
jgi:uncharacterized membrane protein YozB (DUF420 family)